MDSGWGWYLGQKYWWPSGRGVGHLMWEWNQRSRATCIVPWWLADDGFLNKWGRWLYYWRRLRSLIRQPKKSWRWLNTVRTALARFWTIFVWWNFTCWGSLSKNLLCLKLTSHRSRGLRKMWSITFQAILQKSYCADVIRLQMLPLLYMNWGGWLSRGKWFERC